VPARFLRIDSERSRFGVSSTAARGPARGSLFLPERFTAPYFLTGREFIATMLELFGLPYEDERVRVMFAALDLDGTALDSRSATSRRA